MFNNQGERDRLRQEIEATIKPLRAALPVRARAPDRRGPAPGRIALRLRIESVLHAEPAPEQITFDTIVDTVNDQVRIRAAEAA